MQKLSQECDLAIAIGGDGTMLRAASLLVDHDVPLLGINLGRLGFLTDVPADRVEEQLGEILDGNYVEDVRFQLHCEVHRQNDIIMQMN